jgi:N-acetylglutamate synthase-like GNAT family acetyltransferase
MSDTLEKLKKQPDFESLRFMRVFTPDHIPKHLVKQVKYRDWSVDEWYAYQRSICTETVNGKLNNNPLNHLYVIANKDNEVVGYFWAEISVLEQSLVIQTFSMNQDYWCRGKAVRLLEEHAKKIKEEVNLRKIYWVTNYPKTFERYGFKVSKNVLMEYVGETENGKDIHGGELSQECADDASSAAAVP